MDTVIDPTHLAAYIASRICHDLVSPVSSVTSAIDFINDEDDTEMRQQAEQLLKSGAENASARLEFLRYAFGSVGLHDGTADLHEVKRIAERFVDTHKPTLEWHIETEQLNAPHARLMMNMIMLAVDCLPRGGVITVKVQPVEETLTLTLQAAGPRAKLREDTAKALQGEAPDGNWSARSVQPLFTKMIAEGQGGSIMALSSGEADVTIRAQGISGCGA